MYVPYRPPFLFLAPSTQIYHTIPYHAIPSTTIPPIHTMQSYPSYPTPSHKTSWHGTYLTPTHTISPILKHPIVPIRSDRMPFYLIQILSHRYTISYHTISSLLFLLSTPCNSIPPIHTIPCNSIPPFLLHLTRSHSTARILLLPIPSLLS